MEFQEGFLETARVLHTQPSNGLARNSIHRLGKRRQIIRGPGRLLDIVETYHAHLIGYRHREIMARGIHEAAGNQVRCTEDRVRSLTARQQAPRQDTATLVAGHAVAFDDDRHAKNGRRCDEPLFSRHEARRSNGGIRKCQAPAACAGKAGHDAFSRGFIIKIDAERPILLLIPVDQYQSLAVSQAEVADRLVRHS